MAKHIYHLPLKQIEEFKSKQKTLLTKVLNDKDMFLLYKNFGKSFYVLQVREFLKAYKIDRDFSFANRGFNYLFEDVFLKNFYELLGLEKLTTPHGHKKEIFFVYVYLLETQDKKLSNIFIQKVFNHFFNLLPKTNKKNYIQIAQAICKARGFSIKESYSQNTEVAGGGG